ncbi:C69 family dipeptidase [Allofustis seminis]|uniref:C69 family dipeptidase n=1 Tax=Allofustis seminis TaxID=166939 RepID=UPI001FE20700|nr:C69 family dipeptidase [Allofustis seminis]
MKKVFKLMIVAVAFLIALPYSLVEACTGFIIGKDLTKDGYTIFGRTEDLEEHHNKNFVIIPAQTYEDGEVLHDREANQTYKHAKEEYAYYTFYDGDRNSLYGFYGEHGFNEFGVAITATVSAKYNDKIKLVDPYVSTGLTEAVMTNLVLPRVKTAREGIEFIAKTIDEVGAKEGNIVVIADKNETWYMEILSGHQYAAIKFPDNKFAVFPNTFYLGAIDDFKEEDIIISKDLVKTAKTAGSYVERDGKFHVAASYAPPIDDRNRSRTYAGIKNLDPTSKVTYEDDLYELLQSPTDPNKKYTVKDAMALQRDRFENLDKKFVPDDLKGKISLKPGEEYKYSLGNKNVMEAHIYEMRKDIPAEFGGVLWVAMDASRNNAYIPFYGNMKETHKSFQVMNVNYDPNSFYWVADNIDNMASSFPDLFGNTIQEMWKEYEAEAAEELAKQNAYYLEAQLAPDHASFEVTKDALERTEKLFKKMKAVEAEMEAKIKEAGKPYKKFEDGEVPPVFNEVKEKEFITEETEEVPDPAEQIEGKKVRIKSVLKHGIKYEVNPDAPIGRDKIKQQGVDGSMERVVDKNGDQETVLETVKHEPSVPQIIVVGTGLITTQTIPEYTVIDFEVETIEDDTLEKGKTEIVQEGKPGMHVVATRYYKLNNKDYKEEVVYDGVTTEAVKQIVKVGTKVVEEPTPAPEPKPEPAPEPEPKPEPKPEQGKEQSKGDSKKLPKSGMDMLSPLAASGMILAGLGALFEERKRRN